MMKEDVFDFDRKQTVQTVQSAASPVNSLHLPIKFCIWDEIYVFQ